MNLRHASALALVGWYLMVPPTNEHSHKPQADLPLSEWCYKTFDSAQDCESAQGALVDKFLNSAKKEPAQKAYWEGMAESIIQGHCIATDDPRLKEK